MNEDIRKFLKDIQFSIEGIYFHLDGITDFKVYQSKFTTKRAVERELGIIGEAVNRILKSDQYFPLPHAKQIISFRNRVIHGYDSIDDNLVWKIIVVDIPELQSEIKKLM